MSKLDNKQIDHLAKLSRLALSSEEKEKFADELSAILGFVEKLKEVDTDGVSPTSHAGGLVNAMRADEMLPDENPQRLVDAAPAKKDNLVKVKAVFE